MLNNRIHLLWTGGWDSTFRLLELLLVKQRMVQPHYIINSDRASFTKEIQTLKIIKQLVFQKVPGCKELLLPTQFRELTDIKPHPILTKQYANLLALSFLGPQYEWLARFAEELGFSDLELSIHRDDKAHGFLEHSVVRESDGTNSFYRLQSNPSNPDLALFKYFRFPLFEMTKLEMQQQAVEFDFDDILEYTWFCNMPLRNGASCGTCGPCRYTREEGLGRRISFLGHIRYYTLYQANTLIERFRYCQVVGQIR